jgi:hypothetical protein
LDDPRQVVDERAERKLGDQDRHDAPDRCAALCARSDRLHRTDLRVRRGTAHVSGNVEAGRNRPGMGERRIGSIDLTCVTRPTTWRGLPTARSAFSKACARMYGSE